MRYLLGLLLLLKGLLLSGLAAGAVVPELPQRPQRIVSINLCTDQYLLLLADPAQIRSLSFLAHQPDSSYLYRKALAYPANRAEVEQVISYRPDLILGGTFTSRATTRLLQQQGFNIQLLGHPRSLREVEQQLQSLGALLGQQQRAQQVVTQMRQRREQLEQALAAEGIEPAQRPSLLQYAPGGFTQGAETLVGELIRRAGWRNAATELGIVLMGRLDLEQLLQLAPLALVDAPTTAASHSVAEQMLRHPVLAQLSRPRYRIRLDRRLWICGGPWLLDAVDALWQERQRILQLEQARGRAADEADQR
ncbi:ABC transporter substrate-binding protein [Marinobacterium jannaschii]|uniref:ABC transporter substrate-binding protein n=1 Tax=Marinobacterium jannaschii TaxID=64970 RepID=UPI00068494B9|nr:ABC transporter substrate-binding protein [Marinobacterium jannaschii]